MSDVVIPGSLQDQLLAVVDVLELRGRCQGQLSDGQGRVCLLMAICEVIGDASVNGQNPRVLSLVETLRNEIGGESITHWNDAPGRTDAEVLAMVRSAAARAGRPT